MGQQTSKVMTRREFAAEIVLGYLIGMVLFLEGVLILAGVVTVAGWGEGTLVQRVLVGSVVVGLGLVMLAAVTAGSARGGTRNRKPESTTSAARPGAPADDGDGHHEWALGLSPPEGRRDRPDHGSGVAEI